MAHSANKLKHTPSTKLALEDVLKSLQDLIRNDLPPADAAPTEEQPELAIAPAPTAAEVLRELEAELEAMPSAEELDLSSLDLQPAEELTLATEDDISEEISLSGPPETEEITLLPPPEEHSPPPLEVEPPRSEYLQDNAPSGADLSGLEGILDIDVEPGPADDGFAVQC